MTEQATEPRELTTLAGLTNDGAATVQIGLAGELVGLDVGEAVAHAQHVLEAAAIADVEASMYRWLVADTRRQENVDEHEAHDRALKIIYGFRRFRSEEAPYPVIGGDPDADEQRAVHEPPAEP